MSFGHHGICGVSYGHKVAPVHHHHGHGSGFAIIVVLFILLVIIGAAVCY